MKKFRIIQTAILASFVSVLIGCGSARGYPYDHTGASFSLILGRGSGIHPDRYPDGSYYYRNPQGYIYWQGPDNRFYLDQSYLGKVHYNKREYNDWKRHHGHHHSDRNEDHDRDHDRGHGRHH